MGWPKGKKRGSKKTIAVEIEMTEPVLHGATGRPVIEICPNCMYAYADGGYCEECGWSKPVVMGRQWP